jgi:hypothetical protein
MRKVFIIAGNSIQANMYAKSIGLTREDYKYVRRSNDFRGCRNALLIELDNAFLNSNYYHLLEIARLSNFTKVRIYSE